MSEQDSWGVTGERMFQGTRGWRESQTSMGGTEGQLPTWESNSHFTDTEDWARVAESIFLQVTATLHLLQKRPVLTKGHALQDGAEAGMESREGKGKPIQKPS